MEEKIDYGVSHIDQGVSFSLELGVDLAVEPFPDLYQGLGLGIISAVRLGPPDRWTSTELFEGHSLPRPIGIKSPELVTWFFCIHEH
jgi:hypothetical protein